MAVVAPGTKNTTNNNVVTGPVVVLLPPPVMSPHPAFHIPAIVEPAGSNKDLELGAHVRAKILTGGCRVPSMVPSHRPANSPPPVLASFNATTHVSHAPPGVNVESL